MRRHAAGNGTFYRRWPDFNFCKLIAGSEGTLAFITEIKLNVVPLAAEGTRFAYAFISILSTKRCGPTLLLLKYGPSASELIDHYILECTKDNIEQIQNRFFVQGDPGAILVIEYSRDNREEVIEIAKKVEAEMRAAGLGYHFPLLFGRRHQKDMDFAQSWSGLA